MKRKILTTVVALSIILGLFQFYDYTASNNSEAQCVPYIPLIRTYDSGTLNFPNGQPCVSINNIRVDFGVTLFQSGSQGPLVTLKKSRFSFTDEDHHYGLGSVRMTGNPRIIGGIGSIVEFDVQVCFRDQDSADPRSYDFSYTIGAWPAF